MEEKVRGLLVAARYAVYEEVGFAAAGHLGSPCGDGAKHRDGAMSEISERWARHDRAPSVTIERLWPQAKAS